MVAVCSIYLLKNIINNKLYIGQTWLPLNIRMGKNGKNYKNSTYLYNAIKKYGSNNFIYEILVQCKDQISADYLEEFFINNYNSNKIGYNIKNGGSVGKHSDKTKKKISESLKSKVWSIKAILGRKTAGKQWLGKKRGKQSFSRKITVSNFMKKWHEENMHPMLGKHHSEESKLKISIAGKGRKLDSDMVKKRSLKLMMNVQKESGIIQSYLNNILIQDIEIEFKTSRSSIYRVLKRNNISLKGK